MNNSLAYAMNKQTTRVTFRKAINLLSMFIFTLFFMFTPLQPYLDGPVLYALFGIWIISALTIDSRWFKKSVPVIVCILIYGAMIIGEGIILDSQAQIYDLGQSYIYSFGFMLMGIFYCYNFRRFKLNKFFILFILALAISSVLTIIGLNKYPTASRDMASGINPLVPTFKQMGIGGYGYVYQMPYFILLFTFLLSIKRNKVVKNIILLALIVLCSLMVYKSDYTTALLTVLVSIILAIIFKSGQNSFIKCVIILLLVLIAYIFKVQILELLASFFDQDSVIYLRIKELQATFISGATFNRFELMKHSIDAFFASPIWGQFGIVKTVGGHSDFVDTLGRYGIIGFVVYNAIFFLVARLQYKQLHTGKYKVYFLVVQFVFLFNRITNTILGSQNIFAAVYFIVPTILVKLDSMAYRKRAGEVKDHKKIEDREI